MKIKIDESMFPNEESIKKIKVKKEKKSYLSRMKWYKIMNKYPIANFIEVLTCSSKNNNSCYTLEEFVKTFGRSLIYTNSYLRLMELKEKKRKCQEN